MNGQGSKWRRKIAENFKRLSRVHERYRQTTDNRQTDRQTEGTAIAENFACRLQTVTDHITGGRNPSTRVSDLLPDGYPVKKSVKSYHCWSRQLTEKSYVRIS